MAVRTTLVGKEVFNLSASRSRLKLFCKYNLTFPASVTQERKLRTRSIGVMLIRVLNVFGYMYELRHNYRNYFFIYIFYRRSLKLSLTQRYFQDKLPNLEGKGYLPRLL